MGAIQHSDLLSLPMVEQAVEVVMVAHLQDLEVVQECQHHCYLKEVQELLEVILKVAVAVVLEALAVVKMVDLVLLFLKFLLLMVIVDSLRVVEEVEIMVMLLVELVVAAMVKQVLLELPTPEEVEEELLMVVTRVLVDPVYV